MAGIAILSKVFFTLDKVAFALTEQEIIQNYTISGASTNVYGVRYQGVYPSQVYEQDGIYYNTAYITYNQRIYFGQGDNTFLNGLINYDNNIIVTLSDSSGIIRNLQITNMSNWDNVNQSISVNTFTSNSGTCNASYKTRVVYNNYNLYGNPKRIANMIQMYVVITWESNVEGSYAQILIDPQAPSSENITRSNEPNTDVSIKYAIIDALAESDDIQLTIDYLSSLDDNVNDIYLYLQSNYPTFTARLNRIIELQSQTINKVAQLWGTVLEIQTLLEASVEASQVESKIEEEQSIQASLEEEMTYETIDAQLEVDYAVDIVNDQVDHVASNDLWGWTNKPIVLTLLITSLTFAIVGFVIYGKGK